MSLSSILKDIEKGVEFPFSWLHTHGAEVNADLAKAQVVLNDGALVAAAANEPAAAAALNRASGGLTIVEAGITAQTNATNLAATVKGITDLSVALEPTLGIKDAGTVAALAAGKTEVDNVAATLNKVVAAAPAS